MKRERHFRVLKYAGFVASATVLFFAVRYCTQPQPKRRVPPRDYADIAQIGVLRIAIEYNAIGFYVDQDTLSGFHYELAEAFAQEKGLQTSFIPLMDTEQRFSELEGGHCDILAAAVPATSELKDSLLLTHPILLNKQVLVQRKAREEEDSLYIRRQLDLRGRTLHIVKGALVALRIRNLANEMGDTIYVKEVERYGAEQLISLVAHGDIDYAVCDESIALAAADSLSQIDISMAIGFTQFHAWVVSKHAPILLDSLNNWLVRFQKTEAFRRIYRKYYGKRR